MTSRPHLCLVLWYREDALASIPVEPKRGNSNRHRHGLPGETDNMVVRLQLQSTVPVEWTLSFDGDAWSLPGSNGRGRPRRPSAANRVSVKGYILASGLTLVFAGAPEAAHAVVLTLVQDGQTVFEGSPSAVKGLPGRPRKILSAPHQLLHPGVCSRTVSSSFSPRPQGGTVMSKRSTSLLIALSVVVIGAVVFMSREQHADGYRRFGRHRHCRQVSFGADHAEGCRDRQ